MSVAIPKNALDDHYFLFPAYTWRGLDFIGREHLSVLMRPAVRYVARFPTQRVGSRSGCADREAPAADPHPAPAQWRRRDRHDRRIGEAIGQCSNYNEIPVLLAQALADGLSLEGAGEALSIGAAGLFMRSLTGNPMDVHLHTSANLRRYLLRLDGLSMRNKLADPAAVAHRAGGEVHAVPDGAGAAAGSRRRLPHCRTGRRRSCWRRSPRASTTSRRPTGPP